MEGGVWSHILSCSPQQEISEIERFLGIKSIDQNKILWEELNSLKAILVDIRDSFSQTFSSPSPRGRGLKSIRNARNFSDIYYNDHQHMKEAIIKALSPAPHSNNDFEVSIDIFTISEFSLDILHNNDNLKDMIIKFIETENSLLESEILKMNIEIQNSADMDMRNISTQQSPRTLLIKTPTIINTSLEEAPIICESCSMNAKPISNTKLLGPNKAAASKAIKDRVKTTSLYGDSVCSVCKNTQTKLEIHEKEYSSSPLRCELKNTQKNHDSLHDEYSPSTQTEGGEVTPLPSRGNSKFRNKLNTARDELHFFEEF